MTTNMMIEKTNVTRQIQNKNLQRYLNQIDAAALNIQTQALKVCWILKEIAATNAWEDDFDSLEDFGEIKLGKKKATLYNMIAAGDWVDRNGHTIFYNAETKCDFTASQLYAIMRIKASKKATLTENQALAKELFAAGVLNYGLSVQEIKDLVADNNAAKAGTKKRLPKEATKEKPKVIGKAQVTSVSKVRHALEFLESDDGTKLITFEGITCKLTDDEYVQTLARVAEIMSNFEPIMSVDVVETEE